MSDFEDLFADLGAGSLLDEHGEAVTQYPLGVSANAVSVTAIVDLSSEGEAPIDSPDGSQVVRWGVLGLAAAVNVTQAERAQQRDQFLVRGQIWDAWKILSRDSGLQVLRIRRIEAASTRRSRV